MVGGVRLSEVMRLPSLAGARVVAGADGTDRLVRRVNVMEVPDILGWVGEDELLLTTAYPLRDDPEALAALVPALAERGLAGLAIKPARYIPTIPGSARSAADALAFPLIELPADSSFNEIITSVLAVILNEQAARLQRRADIHERFTSIVLGGGGLRQIADALAAAIGRRVAILDAAGGVLAGTMNHGPVGDASDLTIHEIRVGGEQFGSLVVELDGRPLDDEQADAVEYAATITALRQVQARAVAEADRRFQAVCLEELITGHVDRAVLTERAAAFDWDLSIPRAVLVGRLDAAGPADGAGLRRRFAEVVRQTLGRGGIVWERTSEVAALIPADRSVAQIRETAEHIGLEAERVLSGTRPRLGVGRARNDPLELSASFAEARRALAVMAKGGADGRATLFDDLGVDRLLASVPATEAEDFARSQLGRLLDHDARHRTSLVASLEAYLETRNAALAARRLFVHYNTMKHRLRLIEELIGPVRDDADRCLALALALRIVRAPR